MIKDSGSRKKYSTGANRDENSTKPRCTLLPESAVSRMMANKSSYGLFELLDLLNLEIKEYIKEPVSIFVGRKQNKTHPTINDPNAFDDSLCEDIIEVFNRLYFNGDMSNHILDLAQHFTNGVNKYNNAEDNTPNYQKGLPLSGYLDSAYRHLFKFINGLDDEPHDMAFLWNILCMEWTVNNLDWETIVQLEKEYNDNSVVAKIETSEIDLIMKNKMLNGEKLTYEEVKYILCESEIQKLDEMATCDFGAPDYKVETILKVENKCYCLTTREDKYGDDKYIDYKSQIAIDVSEKGAGDSVVAKNATQETPESEPQYSWKE